MKRKSEASRQTNCAVERPPCLLIGWGREGVKDIKSARDAFPFDKGLDCVDAGAMQGQEILDEIVEWLEGNENAQVLYIGSHGDDKGLYPVAERDEFTPKIIWSSLGSALSRASAPITLWLGACSSVFAAKDWSDKPVLLPSKTGHLI